MVVSHSRKPGTLLDGSDGLGSTRFTMNVSRVIPKTFVSLALTCTACLFAAACDTADDDGDTTGDETGGEVSGCFIRAELEESDGSVIAYEVPAIVNQTDPDRHAIETDFLAVETDHVLRISWAAELAPGDYPLQDVSNGEVIFMITSNLTAGALGEPFAVGTATFTSLDPLAGSVAVTRRPTNGDDRYVVDARNVEFGCE